MALAILIFHYQKWTTDTWQANGIIGALGVYGVSIFFVLSGIVLTLSTKRKEVQLSSNPTAFWKTFFQRRFWRIFPLLWLATLVTLVLDEFDWSTSDIFLNLSGLFGFIKPHGDIATGAWSIGCELVFYALFPLFYWVLKQFYKKGAILLGLFSSAFCGYIAFFVLDSVQDIKAQWATYVHPLFHVFFFVFGMLIAYFLDLKKKTNTFEKTAFLLTLLASIYSVFFIVDSPTELISGWPRLLFSFTCIWGCKLAFSKANLPTNTVLSSFGNWLGDVSYSLYLLHPIVYRVVRAFFEKISPESESWVLLLLAVPLTFVASHFGYYWFEKRFLKAPLKAPLNLPEGER